MKRFPNMKDAFDDYANKGAIFRGQKVQDVPQLVELYKRISNHSGDITSAMLEDELRNIFANPQNTNQNDNPANQTPSNANNNPGTLDQQNNPANITGNKTVTLNSSDPKSFANDILNFMESKGKDKNLVKTFNDYADAGAKYNGVSIKNIPALQKVYTQILNSSGFLEESQIENLVSQAVNQQNAPNNNTGPSNVTLSSNNPKSFASDLLNFMESRGGDKNLVKAFDDYANAGATFNGVSIKDNPALVKEWGVPYIDQVKERVKRIMESRDDKINPPHYKNVAAGKQYMELNERFNVLERVICKGKYDGLC
jgi:phage gp16-like protein